MRLVTIPHSRAQVPLLAALEVTAPAAGLWPQPPWEVRLLLPGHQPWPLVFERAPEDVPADVDAHGRGRKVLLVRRPTVGTTRDDRQPHGPEVEILDHRRWRVCSGPADDAGVRGLAFASLTCAVEIRLAADWRAMDRRRRTEVLG